MFVGVDGIAEGGLNMQEIESMKKTGYVMEYV